jgi:diguanylate cyclase (GGDEF)-like protein
MRGDRDRRELEVLYRLAVSLPRSLTVTGVTDALAEGLVNAIERACECTITSWEPEANTLTVLSVCEPDGIEPEWRGVVYDLADWPESLAVLEAGSEHREFGVGDASLAPSARAQVEEWTWASWICFPLVVEKRAVGLIELADYHSVDPWSPRDISFGQTIATQAALAVRNAQLYEDLQRQVDHDSLTGLLNHGAFYSRVDEELERIRRSGRPAAALVADLDDFKLVNDRDGHPAGDRALCRVADALRAVCRPGDVAGRIGGDEFCVLLVDLDGDPGEAARRLAQVIELESGVSVSVGVAVCTGADRSAADAIARADRALLDAKRAGKHTFRLAA